MTAFIDDSDRFWRMADAVCMGTASDEELQELEDRVLTDDKARSLYIAYCQLDAALELELGGQHAGMLARDKIRNEMLTAVADDFPSTIPASCPIAHATPALGFLSTAYHGTIGYFSHEIPFSFLMGALFTGLLVLIAWLVPVSSLVQTAKNSSPMPSENQRQFTSTPKMEFVGRITGMVDVQWSDINTSTEQGNGVPLGRKYVLASGLMEITYATGAKVILQGPVTYEVKSKNGGFLSVGKLTGKVEVDTAKGFSIRTPTATVTDLGTEFGVTVSEAGVTQIHVLQGVVDAQRISLHGDVQGQHRRVNAGQAIQVRPKDTQIEAITFAPRLFMRRLDAPADNTAETAYIKTVLADKPMGYWPLNEPAGAQRFYDCSGNGIHGYAMGKPATGRGPLPGNSRAVALDGHSYIDLGRHDEFGMKNDFTVEAWLWIDSPRDTSYAISALGRSPEGYIGWGLIAGRDRPSVKDVTNTPVVLYFNIQQVGRTYVPLSEGESIEKRWLHAAVVFDHDNTAHLYLNGKYRGSKINKPVVVGPTWLQIGCAEVVDTDFWCGRLAHVAIYPHALSAKQIKNHYSQGSSSEKEVVDKHP